MDPSWGLILGLWATFLAGLAWLVAPRGRLHGRCGSRLRDRTPPAPDPVDRSRRTPVGPADGRRDRPPE